MSTSHENSKHDDGDGHNTDINNINLTAELEERPLKEETQRPSNDLDLRSISNIPSSSSSCSNSFDHRLYHHYDVKDDYVLSQEVDATTIPSSSPLFGSSNGSTRAEMKRDLERYLEEQEDSFFETDGEEEGEQGKEKEKESEEVDYFDHGLDDSDFLGLS